jgi:hypothetical protein
MGHFTIIHNDSQIPHFYIWSGNYSHRLMIFKQFLPFQVQAQLFNWRFSLEGKSLLDSSIASQNPAAKSRVPYKIISHLRIQNQGMIQRSQKRANYWRAAFKGGRKGPATISFGSLFLEDTFGHSTRLPGWHKFPASAAPLPSGWDLSHFLFSHTMGWEAC